MIVDRLFVIVGERPQTLLLYLLLSIPLNVGVSFAQQSMVAHDFESGRRLWLSLQYEIRDAFAADRSGNYTEAVRIYEDVAEKPEAAVAFLGARPEQSAQGAPLIL